MTPFMERRLDQRWPANLDVTLTDLADPQHRTGGQIVDVSHSGVRIQTPLRVDPGAIIKLEVADCALFGHVIHCRDDGGLYEIGIEVARVLIGNSDLGRVVNTILAAAIPNTPGVTITQESVN
jgi:hypothetical protein